MAAKTYKCPNCGAYLNFDPETQKWKCPFCDSVLDESELKDDSKSNTEKQTAATTKEGQVVYHCSSCGSVIITDETTVATNCYYCHSPVVLEGKLGEEWKPDFVLPFEISKEKAVSQFMSWAKSKKYVPDAFFQEAAVRGMMGVYYPHFVAECEADGTLDGEGRNNRVVSDAKFITTYTDHYAISRDGKFSFRNIIRPALTKANKKLSDAIHPFPLEKMKSFSPAYLTGFLAERRDIEFSSIVDDVKSEVKRHSDKMLRETVREYHSYNATTNVNIHDVQSKYVLLPTWVLTYPNPVNKEDPYYYAMNGCTGEVSGKLPIDKKKLIRHSAFISLCVLAVALLICYFLV